MTKKIDGKNFNKKRNLSVPVKTAKRRKLSSTLWLKRHLNDPYVIMAKEEGYRSRAAYKLLEINEKFNIFKKNTIIVDLGAAPGGWSQVAIKLGATKVIAIDLTKIEPINKVEFIQGDFTTDEMGEILSKSLTKKADIIMSDMAAPASGHPDIDHIKIIELCHQTFSFVKDNLAPCGTFIVKLLVGGEEKLFVDSIRKYFAKIKRFKPQASYSNSAEIYLIAQNFKVLNQEIKQN